MFINKSIDGRNNICGKKISELRRELDISQRELAEKLQLNGLDIDKMPFNELRQVRGLLRILKSLH